MYDGVLARLTDHQVSPLHDHDRHEERRVTRILQNLPLRVCLLHQTNTLTYIYTIVSHYDKQLRHQRRCQNM